MPIQNDINFGGSTFQRPQVPNDTYNVVIKDVKGRHVKVNKFTGEPQDVIDFDFEIADGDHKGTVVGKYYVSTKVSPPSEGRSASNIYLILSALYGTPDEKLLATWRENTANVLNDAIGSKLRILTTDSKVINFLPAKK